MKLFKNLRLQEVEPEDAASPLDRHFSGEITLDDSIDAEALDRWWGTVLRDESFEG